MCGYICPYCGDHLDPGESCDCLEKKERTNLLISDMLSSDSDGQIVIKEVMQNAVWLG